MPDQQPEAVRLESLWRGDFGNQYVERNVDAGAARRDFWQGHLDRFPATSALEVGCNMGANLRHLVDLMPATNVWGLDVNEASLEHLHTTHPRINGGWGVARDLPFRDRHFDLVFTVAVLIHQPEETLALAMAEMVRCSRRWIAAVEYVSDDTQVVDYRGQHRAFFKRDYGRVFTELFPELTLVHDGELTRADGFDDGMGYWVLERR